MFKRITLFLACLNCLALFSQFTNVTENALPETIRGAYSVAWVDINNNGLQDVFIAPYYFYLNNGDGTFTAKEYDEFTDWGISSNTRVAFADANNNGYIDMVISDHSHTTVDRARYCYFFANSGPPNYTFEGQIIYELPLNIKGGQPVFLDATGDGKMEIYLATFGNWSPNYAVGMDQLFKQDNEGGWENVTAERIPELTNPNTHRPSRGVNTCDYNMNFHTDIFVPVYTVGSFNAANFLWLNDGNGHFSDYAAQAGVDLEPHCRYQLGLASGAAFGDFNNNGWFDLCVANIHGWAAVYENNGDGTFSNVTEHTGLDLGLGGTPQEKQWHNANWIDHNNNGYLDLWLTQWYGNEGFFCFVYENQGPENPGFFIDVTEELGFNKRQEFNDIQGLAAGDFNGSGFIDILMHTRATFDTQYRGNYLFRNEGNDNNWMQIKLVGDGNNVSKTAVGCQARIFYKDGTASYIKQVESTSSDQSMHQHVLHFGLGQQEEIQQIMVRWLDGRVEYWQGEEIEGINRIITLEYGEGSLNSTVLAVDQDYTGESDGSVYKPYTSIQQAINRSQSGFIVTVAPGHYFENIDFSGKDIRLKAAGAVDETIVMGSALGQPKVIFQGRETNNAILEGFTIMGELGKGISCINSSPTILRCHIIRNVGAEGGAFHLQNSQAKIIDCQIIMNEADSGGAIFAENSSITVIRCYIQENSAGAGAVIKGTGTSVRLENSLITNNSSREGGVINLSAGSLDMEFCTFSANNRGMTLTGVPSANGWKIINSIVYGNGDFEFHNDHPLNVSYSNIGTPIGGTGNIFTDPLFSPDEEWRLSPFSNCIGAGLASGVAVDITGAPRPQPADSAPDMGCYENERSAPAPKQLYVSVSGSNTEGTGTLQNPYKTISYALANTLGGETIIVAPGTYHENIDFNGKNSRIVSYFEHTGVIRYIYDTIIDGGDDGAVISFRNSENNRAGITGFTITNGRSSNGAGIIINGADPVLSHLRVIGNTASVNGGGIIVQQSNAVLRDIMVADNQAGNFGGGIFIINSRPVLERIDIHQNSANMNGGLAVNYSSLAGKHLTVADNSAVGGNPVTGGVLSVNSTVYLINSILWGNIPNQTGLMLDGTIDAFYSNIQGGFQGEGNIDSDPLFVNTEENDYRLSSNSPCIDAGTAYYQHDGVELINLSPTDYTGNAPDMGAYDLLLANIDDSLPAAAEKLTIRTAPNPFNPSTMISFNLPARDNTYLTIYNIKGQLVKRLIDGEVIDAGEHSIVWNGTDAAGVFQASGVYLLRLTNGSQGVTTKVMLLK